METVKVLYNSWDNLVNSNPLWKIRWVAISSGGYFAICGHPQISFETLITSISDISNFELNHKNNGLQSPTPDSAFADIIATSTVAESNTGTSASIGSSASNEGTFVVGEDGIGNIKPLPIGISGQQASNVGLPICGTDGYSYQEVKVRSNGALRVESIPYLTNIAQGKVPNHIVGSRIAEVAVASLNTKTLLVSGIWNEQTSGGQWSVSSNSSSDTSNGQGAKAIRVSFITDSGLRINEYFALNGVTPVPFAATNALYLDGITVIDVGSNTVTQGDISIYSNNDGTGQIIGQVISGKMSLDSAVQYTASNETGFMSNVIALTNNKQMVFDFYTYENYSNENVLGGTMIKSHKLSIASAKGQGSGEIPSTIIVSPNGKFEVYATTDNPGDIATISLFGWFEIN